ncbi:MAG: organic hydroperoxide resistance protein [Parvularcula sp.]|jgi:Ohr subfamily peroxiredoxin|nr:organic hydroperoxide resistance protein [Parvularcula sp.]
MKAIYTGKARSEGGRTGRIVADNGSYELKLTVPQQMGGPGGEGTNPEEIFAGGYAACFHSALQHVAGDKADLSGSEVHGAVSIGQRETGPGFGLAVTLDIHLPHVPKNQAEELVAQTHEVCPYSNATRGNIDVTLNVHAA